MYQMMAISITIVKSSARDAKRWDIERVVSRIKKREERDCSRPPRVEDYAIWFSISPINFLFPLSVTIALGSK